MDNQQEGERERERRPLRLLSAVDTGAAKLMQLLNVWLTGAPLVDTAVHLLLLLLLMLLFLLPLTAVSVSTHAATSIFSTTTANQ